VNGQHIPILRETGRWLMGDRQVANRGQLSITPKRG
jgi:hypothetical protein